MSKKNILDEFWIDWDQKNWQDKYSTMKKVAHRLAETIPTKEDLDNLREKTKNVKEAENKDLITPNEKYLEKVHEEISNKYDEDYDVFAKMEDPSTEALTCRRQLDNGEITIQEYAEKIKKVPKGTVPVILDNFWAQWESKSIEEQVHLVMAAINYPHEGIQSSIDSLNLGAYIQDVQRKLGCYLPNFF